MIRPSVSSEPKVVEKRPQPEVEEAAPAKQQPAVKRAKKGGQATASVRVQAAAAANINARMFQKPAQPQARMNVISAFFTTPKPPAVTS